MIDVHCPVDDALSEMREGKIMVCAYNGVRYRFIGRTLMWDYTGTWTPTLLKQEKLSSEWYEEEN